MTEDGRQRTEDRGRTAEAERELFVQISTHGRDARATIGFGINPASWGVCHLIGLMSQFCCFWAWA
jgi:hypothetical protein